MNEKQKLYTIAAVVIALVALVLGTVLVKSNQGKKIIKQFDAAMASGENQAIYIMRTGCSWCSIFDPQVVELEKNYDAKVLKIDTNDITSSQFNYILEKLSLDSKDFGTPYMAVVKDGKKLGEIPGYDTTDAVFAFLQKHGIIKSDAKLPLNYITYAQYKEILASGEKQVLVLGQTGCSACIAASPALDAIAKEYNVKINYLNVTKLSKDEQTEFNKSLTYLTENDWGTPLMLVVENNKVVNASKGFYDKDTYVKFLKDNGFIK